MERVILQSLALNEEFARKSLPYIKLGYFQDHSEKVVFGLIKHYIEKYNTGPSRTALLIDLGKCSGLNESIFKEASDIIESFDESQQLDFQWLVDTTERWCQERAIYNALYESISIVEDKTGKKQKGIIPELLTSALSVSFGQSLGHDYLEDADARFEYYHAPQHKLPFDLKALDEITNGGATRKSLSVFMGGVGFGKTMIMCNLAANNLKRGLKVLYITMEMSKELIGQRIDANLLDYSLSDIISIDEETYKRKVERLKKLYTGKIIIEEYPTSCAGASHFRHLLHELKLKKNFIPDVIYIDYLNICCSSRVKMSVGMYQYVLCISEEIRGLAQEQNCVIISATQMNREGFTSSDPGLENVSQSFGLPATCDFLAAIITNSDLAEMNQMIVKQLKNRWGDIFKNQRFAIGVDRDKQRLYDLEIDSVNDDPVIEAGNQFGNFNSKFKKLSGQDFK